MKRIRFEPLHGMLETIVPDVEMTFRRGEVKEVSDDDARTLLTNPNFVDDELGVNPNHRCAVCGTTTLADFFPGPNDVGVRYRDEHGNRVCVSDFLEAHPEWRKWHDVLERRGRGERLSPRIIRDATRSSPMEPADGPKLYPPGTFSTEQTTADIADHRVERRARVMRSLRIHKHRGLSTMDAYDRHMASVADAGRRYFAAWPAERRTVLAAHEAAGTSLVSAFGFQDVHEARKWFEDQPDVTIGELDAALLSRWQGQGPAPSSAWLRFRGWLDLNEDSSGGVLGSVITAWTIPIVSSTEISHVLRAPLPDLKDWPPVMIVPTGSFVEFAAEPDDRAVQHVLGRLGAQVVGSSDAFTEADMPAGPLREKFAALKQQMAARFLLPARLMSAPEVRAAYRDFGRSFYAWRKSSRRKGRTGQRLAPFFSGRLSFPIVNTKLTFGAHLALSSRNAWKQDADDLPYYTDRYFSSLRFSFETGPAQSRDASNHPRGKRRLSELEASIIHDAVMAKWLHARHTNTLESDGSVNVHVDDILELRGYKKHKHGGFRPEQKRDIANAILSLDRIIVTGQYTAPDRREHSVSGRLVNVTLDQELSAGGEAIPFGFRIRPGDSTFRHYDDQRFRAEYFTSLAKLDISRDLGRMTYLIGRYLVFQYRIRESKGNFDQPFAVRTLLERSGIPIEANANHYTRFNEQVDNALEKLRSIGVISAWQYVRGDSPVSGWFQAWLDDAVRIEPPSLIRDRSDRRVKAFAKRLRRTGTKNT